MLNKTNKYQTLLAICLLILSACSSNESLSDSPNNQGKTPIELSVGIVGENAAVPSAQTRTVITNDSPYGNPATAFTDATSLYMVLKSEYGGTGTAQAPKYSRSIGTVPGSGGTNPLNVSFASGYQRYWEDSYSRDSKVSVYSACVPGNTSTALNIASSTTYNQNDYTWPSTTITPTIAWPLTGVTGTLSSQDAAYLTNQDLCFSNNVSGDNRIDFNSSNNQFNPRRMYFHHALTKVTFKIKKGDGFGSDPFAFTNSGENIVLTGFNTSGTLDISTGEFESIGTADITSLADTKTYADETAGYTYVFTGLMLPGSALTSTATNEVYFTIDNNKYHITKSQLASALSDKTLTNNSLNALDEGSTMRPGVHYVFTLTVSKKKIDKLTASIVEWETVNADGMTPSNARITVSLLDNGTKKTGDADFDLYRKASVSGTISDDFEDYVWSTGYVPSGTPTLNKAILVENTTNSGIYTAKESTIASNPEWYWPDNKTFYHFRTVMPKNRLVTEDGMNGDYISLAKGVGASYTDVCWGAPFNNTTEKLTYSLTTGFDNTSSTSHQISRAIGPTTEAINMVMFHMMSDVTIKLTTTEGADAVELASANLSFSNIYPTGTVLMGNGLVTPTGTPTTAGGIVSHVSSTYQLNYGFVPQSLTNVVLTITTTDGNRYIVDMESVVATTVGNNLIANTYSKDSNNKYIINRWYPNYKYTYTFNLKKSGVETISATLANWETVTADEETVVIQ